MSRLILNSKGFNSKVGSEQIKGIIGQEDLAHRTLYLVSLPYYEVDDLIEENCREILGFSRENLYFSRDGIPEGVKMDYVYVTEGNVFRILEYMRTFGLMDYVRDLVQSGTTYIGSSAGAALAGTDVLLARDFDPGYSPMTDVRSLGFFEGALIPHYEKEQLERYLAELPEHIKERYPVIYSVNNREVMVLERELTEG